MARINKKAFAKELSTQDVFTNTPLYKIEEFVEDFFNIIKTEVIAGNEVAIPDFGKFVNFERQNGSRAPKFRPFTDFADKVAG